MAEQSPNWVELPPDVTAAILSRLGAAEVLESAQKVCTTWRRICQDPAMWRTVDMCNLGHFSTSNNYEAMTMHAVDRSSGQLAAISVGFFCTDALLAYISDRSSQLRLLRLVCCDDISDIGWMEAVKKLPLLEELHLYYTSISKEAIGVVGRCCPLLKSLKLNNQGSRRPYIDCDDEALAIAENMPGLHHLQLFGNKITKDGLQAILDNCPHLESLDLRQCFNVNFGGNLGKRCSQQIKNVRRPYDSTEDYEFDTDILDYESFDEDHPTSFSDIDFMSEDDEHYVFSGGSNVSYDEDYAEYCLMIS
ncbi:hypothetical protein RJ640_015927 [Escallonia rubra]|uniref:F-box domain-containing protein n=1 Tax=Escallonia rubra TaxID=112253 RepID=A0AA88R1V0_9ASTE|nr:hypothetical protein RJ640_015927 [Escallonia rubra]